MRFPTLGLKIVCALTLAVVVAACAATPRIERAPQPSAPVDAERFYTGVWYEIGRRPMQITENCVAGATRYQRLTDTRVRVRDTCQMATPRGREKAIGGPATILNPGVNTKLRVHYRFLGFVPITRDYWIIDHDPDYAWFISADPAFENLWIYTRDAHPSPAVVTNLAARARALGYDTAVLEFPEQ